jgi:hypothetical protein
MDILAQVDANKDTGCQIRNCAINIEHYYWKQRNET